MKYAAEIVDGLVVRVLVVDSLAWASITLGGEWIECKADGSIRGCFPSPGYSYDEGTDVFLPPVEPA